MIGKQAYVDEDTYMMKGVAVYKVDQGIRVRAMQRVTQRQL